VEIESPPLHVGYGFALVDIAAALLFAAPPFCFLATPVCPYVERWALELASYLGAAVQAVASYLFHLGV
jgi:hypothetical protein